MDEPTSSLTDRETSRLFKVIRDLKQRGISVVFISHKLSEVFEITDRVAVLRDGRNAGEVDAKTGTIEELIKPDGGPGPGLSRRPRGQRQAGPEMLRVEALVARPW